MPNEAKPKYKLCKRRQGPPTAKERRAIEKTRKRLSREYAERELRDWARQYKPHLADAPLSRIAEAKEASTRITGRDLMITINAR